MNAECFVCVCELVFNQERTLGRGEDNTGTEEAVCGNLNLSTWHVLSADVTTQVKLKARARMAAWIRGLE